MGALKQAPDACSSAVPRHLVLIMDGNGRWATLRNLPRIYGHQAGVRSLQRLLPLCVARQIRILTVFAFSSENWQRPQVEVQRLLQIFEQALAGKLAVLHRQGVRLRFIGDRTAFPGPLRQLMETAERMTRENACLQLGVAVNYGGRWDICQALQLLVAAVQQGELSPRQIDEERIRACLSLGDLPDPDLLIRTGGEQRISNYLLWQSAYTELYFSDCLWPDFSARQLDAALCWYAGRQRRFGTLGAQAES